MPDRIQNPQTRDLLCRYSVGPDHEEYPGLSYLSSCRTGKETALSAGYPVLIDSPFMNVSIPYGYQKEKHAAKTDSVFACFPACFSHSLMKCVCQPQYSLIKCVNKPQYSLMKCVKSSDIRSCFVATILSTSIASTINA